MSDTPTPLSDWIGRQEVAHDHIAATPVKALNATLDHAAMDVVDGSALPPLWHWLYFLPLHRQSRIYARDGSWRDDPVFAGLPRVRTTLRGRLTAGVTLGPRWSASARASQTTIRRNRPG